MNNTVNLHEHDIHKDTLSMTIHLLKIVQQMIYIKISIFRLLQRLKRRRGQYSAIYVVILFYYHTEEVILQPPREHII